MSENHLTSSSSVNGTTSSMEIAQSNQDLILTKSKRKKHTWIAVGFISGVVLALVIAAIVLLVHERTVESATSQESRKAALSLEDILQGRVNPTSFNATWTSGNELLYTDSQGNLVLRNLANNSFKQLLSNSDFLMPTAFEFTLSADKQFLMVKLDYQKVYRHSYRAKHFIVKLSSPNERFAISAGKGANSELIQLAEWSPVGNAFVFVHEFNIYYKSSVEEGAPRKLTDEGPFIYNGVPDWVYEEEVFSSNKALWFSPDGQQLSFARFNDSLTPVMVVPIYGEPGNPLYQYPRANIVKYPKAGTKNPSVSLHVINLTNPQSTTKTLEVPSEFKEPILTSVIWCDNASLVAIWMNRVQNHAELVFYNAFNETKNVIRNLSSPGWLELFTQPLIGHSGTKLSLILSQNQGEKGDFRHLVLLDKKVDSQITALTKGLFVVTELVGWDQKNDKIFYLANIEGDSAQQHLFEVSVKDKSSSCITCNLTNSRSKQCLYNTVDFSIDFSFYILTCAGPEVPEVMVFDASHKKLFVWDDNEELTKLVEDKELPKVVKMSFEIAGGFEAQVSLRLPQNIDLSGATKYPMLVNVYGGPDSYQVIDRFGLDWGSYLASNKSIIYAIIDGRGSGLKGDKLLFSGYRNLGTVEIIDQINVTSLLQKKLPYIDSTRTAIWGWSYGGYASGMALSLDSDGVFKCGISVAPVTDWALYDSIYTERFMGLPTPEDNLRGYVNAQLFSKYKGLRDKEYFLIHGTYDDNVHYQQSMLWAKTLEQHDILFRQLSYSDEDHGLGLVRPHLYHSLENFLDECFSVKDD